MLMSDLLGERLRSKPSEASLSSHIFLVRGGYVRSIGSGIFSLLTPAVRVQRKIEAIIRREMDGIGGQEVLLPVVLPGELWKESGRFDTVGSELVRFKDRTGRDMVLGMTHEEAAVQLAKSEAKSYLVYPFMIYQIQMKFRDEPRARGGLIRVREFTMKDAYSFHTSQRDLEEYYEWVYQAYVRIFEAAGLEDVIAIASDTGMMGGSKAHEFMLLSEAGEDSIVLCEACGYKANMEVATAKIEQNTGSDAEKREVLTVGVKSIDELAEYLNVQKSKIVKSVLYHVDGRNRPLVVFIRGDLQVNEAKLKNCVGAGIRELADPGKYVLVAGFIGPDDQVLNICDAIFDQSLKDAKDMVCGANKIDTHLTGVSVERDLKVCEFYDVSKVNVGHACDCCGAEISVKRGIEVGNIFQLGTKYTHSMGMMYVSNSGSEETPIMGCYGIGIGRLLACIIEQHHDDFGPIWPKKIAPWQVHICVLNSTISEVKEAGDSLYSALSGTYEVIMDDRNLAAGVQFADADLLGVPVRVVVSKRNVENGNVEVSLRGKKDRLSMGMEELRTFLKDFYGV